MRPEWFPDWSGASALIVAAGPSAKKIGPGAITGGRGGFRVIAVNESWRLFPNADVLYAADSLWWRQSQGCPDFHGLKVGGQEFGEQVAWNVHIVRVESERKDRHNFLTDDPGTVGNGRHSGFQAINLAVQFGAKRLILLGYDYHDREGLHWHGKHPRPLGNPTVQKFEQWRRSIDDAAPGLAKLGVEVLNASIGSALTAFPFVALDSALP